MQLPILVEPMPDGRFRARLGEPIAATAEADNAQRAVQELVQLVENRLHSGAKLFVLSIPSGAVQGSAPPFPADDAYKTDWVYRELEEAVAENRRLEESAGP
jgi:hypothetical protein